MSSYFLFASFIYIFIHSLQCNHHDLEPENKVLLQNRRYSQIGSQLSPMQISKKGESFLAVTKIKALFTIYTRRASQLALREAFFCPANQASFRSRADSVNAIRVSFICGENCNAVNHTYTASG